MIRVPRERADEAGVLIRPDQVWFELASESRARALAEGVAHAVSAAVYGHPQVRMALEKLFHDKCAYCEGKSFGQADWDVEHFRPKAGVAERDDHPGYYWLAYEWENLYLSCTHCNQRRRDRPRWGDTSAGIAQGKLDQFPLARESSRAMGPGDDHLEEEALLLDPCRDDPEQHVRFDVHGAPLPVGDSLRGSASIAIFHLARKRLRDQRKSRIDNVVRLLTVIRSLQRELGSGHPAVAEVRQVLETIYLVDSADFAAVARWVVRDPGAFGL
jgi:uncharacterized protein (TIGR02646 family)